MTIFQSIILGIVQGLTEYLPISSSAHLVLVPYLLGWQMAADASFAFDVLVQLSTLLAVIVYFWKDLLMIATAFINGLIKRQPFADPDARLGWYIIIATIPAGIFGLTVKNAVEAAFDSPIMTAFFLICTAVILIVAEKVGKRNRGLGTITWVDALWIGLFQAASIFPGVSRSGSTITGGMTRNLDRPSAARFSFLMSIPIMLAAGLWTSLDLMNTPHVAALLPTFVPGFIAAAIVGYLSIRWLLKYLTGHPLYLFSIYCLGLGGLTLIVGLLRM